MKKILLLSILLTGTIVTTYASRVPAKVNHEKLGYMKTVIKNDIKRNKTMINKLGSYMKNHPLFLTSAVGPVASILLGMFFMYAIDEEKIPTDLTQEGWVFDPDQGERIQGKYLFGKETEISKSDLVFSIGEQELPPPTETSFDESIIILAVIIVGGIAAAITAIGSSGNNSRSF